MKHLISRAIITLAVAALTAATVMSTSAPAQAVATTYRPHGGTVGLIGDDIAFTVIEPDQTFACAQFDAGGNVTDSEASRLFGTPAVVWEDLMTSGCTSPILGPTTINPTGTWGFATTGPEVGSISPAKFTNVTLFFESGGCSFNVAGDITGMFDDVTGLFTPDGSGLVVAGDPIGFLCLVAGLANGHSMSVDGTWRITGLTITNP